MMITIKAGQETLLATLDDNATAKSFADLLPLELELEDYNQTEKIAHLPKKLGVGGAPKGMDPSPGDIAYYAPWGNLALFYRGFGYSAGLVRIGDINSGVESLRGLRRIKVRIALVSRP